MGKKFLTTTGLVLGVVLLFAVNMLAGASLASLRFDLTDHSLYTLSDGTRNILAGLDEPITMRLYLSERELASVPGIGGYANRVKSLLGEYERLSEGQIKVHIIEPEPFSEEEDRAVGYGLRGLPIGVDEGTLYFGLVGTNSTDDEETIPFFTTEREEFLEYDVTKLVHNLSNPKQKVVGVLSSLPILGQGPRPELRGLSAPPWVIIDQMSQLFEVRQLDPKLDTIESDVDVLMIVHPRNLPEDTLYAIDQYVLGGGRALVFVDAYAEAQPPDGPSGAMMMMAPRNVSQRSDLDRLLDAWGVELEKDKVVGDIQLAAKVRMNDGGRVLTFDYPVWVNVQPETFDDEDIVTANLGNVSFGTPGSLVAKQGATTTLTALVSTTDQAMRIDSAKVGSQGDPQALAREYKPEGKAFVLVARLTGPVKSAFPDGAPMASGAEEGEQKPEKGEIGTGRTGPHLAESKEPVQLVLVADSDVLQDRFWVQVQEFLGQRIAVPSAANASLVTNALDNLTGSTDLISVRNRGTFVRPFDKVNELRQAAEREYRQKEEELVKRLQDTEQKLLELEQSKQGDDSMVLTEAQRAELIEFRQQKLRIRKELREVRRQLRSEIESLESWLKFLNIGLVPILIGIFGLVAGMVQLGRRRASITRTATA